MILKCILQSAVFYCLSNFMGALTSDDFKPVTEDKAFRATYNLHGFFQGKPGFESEIFEQYHPTLGSSDVWIKTEESPNEKTRVELPIRRFMYDGVKRRDLEIVGMSRNQIPRELYLFQDGGSSAYQPDLNLANSMTKLSARLLSSSLDMYIFRLIDKKRQAALELDLFLPRDCRAKVDSELHHLRGLSRIFHLLECRRKEFKLRQDAGTTTTRGSPTKIYEAKGLTAPGASASSIGRVTSLDISVNIRADVADSGTKANELPTQVVPLSISIKYSPDAMMLINIYQFEVVDLGEHLSESASSASSFLIPVGRGISQLLAPDIDATTQVQVQHMRFSFRAQVTGSSLPLKGPIELLVAFDGPNRLMARKLSQTDATSSEGDSWAASSSQLILDGQSQMKFHSMRPSASDVDSLATGGDSDGPNFWRSCVVNTLTPFELQFLERGSGEILGLSGASFMGMAIVRGITCYVYERRIYTLPLWMGLGTAEHSQDEESLAKSEIYVTIYEETTQISLKDMEAEREARASDDARGKIVRLVVSYISSPRSGEVLRRYNFELYAFSWSTDQLIQDVPELVDFRQECIQSQATSRHVEMNLMLQHEQTDGSLQRLFNVLDQNDAERQAIMSRILSSSFGIAPAQQVDLVTSIDTNDNLDAHLRVYELPGDRFTFTIVGYARDLAAGSASGGWTVGKTKISLEECLWEAVHSLDPMQGAATEYRKTEEVQIYNLVMFCSKTLHCTLGDDHWKESMTKGSRKFFKDSVVEFPIQDKKSPSRCVIYRVDLTHKQNQVQTNLVQTLGLPHLEYLAINYQRMLDLPVEFNLDDTGYLMTVSKIKVSNVLGGDEASKGLVQPLHGVAYDSSGSGVQPTVVKTLAQCGHLCLMDHRCQSYSTCHTDGGSRLECLLTKVNWTEASKVMELKSFISRPSISPGSRTKKIKVFLVNSDSISSNNDDVRAQVEVNIRRSSLCTLHPSKQVDWFQLKATGLERTPRTKHLLSASSAGDCARFCLDRAHIMNSIASGQQVSKSDRSKYTKAQMMGFNLQSDQNEPQLLQISDSVCTEFKFSRELELCQLLPQLDLADRFRQVKSASKSLLIERMRTSFERMQTREKELPVFGDTDHYALDFEQMFESHPRFHLVPDDSKTTSGRIRNGNSNGREMQATLADTAAHDCARICLSSPTCRSFDVEKLIVLPEDQVVAKVEAPTSGGLGKQQATRLRASAASAALGTCVLNAESAADIIRGRRRIDGNQSSGLRLERIELPPGEATTSVWHYEPTDLALYVSGLYASQMNGDDGLVSSSQISGDQLVAPAVEGQSSSSAAVESRARSQIFIEVKATDLAHELLLAASGSHEQKVPDGSSEANASHGSVVGGSAIILVVFAVVILAIVLTIVKKNRPLVSDLLRWPSRVFSKRQPLV